MIFSISFFGAGKSTFPNKNIAPRNKIKRKVNFIIKPVAPLRELEFLINCI